MPLTLAQMHALFNDNTAGDISAQDGRDVLEALWRRIYGVEAAPGADDVYWDGDDSASMTEVTVSGSQTIVENGGYLSVNFSGQGAQDFNGILKAHTFSVGDSFAVETRLLSGAVAGLQGHVGIAFTDGTTSGSNAVTSSIQQNQANAPTFVARHGTLAAMTTAASQTPSLILPAWWLRLTYTASNTFQVSISPDGISYTTLTHAATSKTMTPTHVGLVWSKDATSGEGVGTFGPIRKLA